MTANIVTLTRLLSAEVVCSVKSIFIMHSLHFNLKKAKAAENELRSLGLIEIIQLIIRT